MARTPSTMIALGTHMPRFALPDSVTGKTITSESLSAAKAVLVMFICNHCPFVKHVREELARLGRDYGSKGVAIVAINANDIATHPEDSPEKMAEEARAAGYTFPYLFDESQGVAKAFVAACTPDFFLFDSSRRLVYRGQLDDSRPSKYLDGKVVPVTGRDLRAAMDAVLGGKAVAAEQWPSLGCNIKWKPGNEPGAP